MTGFTASAFLSRNRVSLKEAFEGLELCERKLSCTVLRGLDGSNPVRLLGQLDTNGNLRNQWTQARFPLLMQCNFLKADARLHPVTSDVSGNLGMRRHTANGRG